jgi:hypothetical protein
LSWAAWLTPLGTQGSLKYWEVFDMAGLYIVVLDKRAEEASKRVEAVERDINKCQLLVVGMAVIAAAAFLSLSLWLF